MIIFKVHFFSLFLWFAILAESSFRMNLECAPATKRPIRLFRHFRLDSKTATFYANTTKGQRDSQMFHFY